MALLLLLLLLLLLEVLLASTMVPPIRDEKDPRFTGATFIFGDSLVDTGNNNYLLSLARADLRPDGIDFAPSGGNPTGRFTNGKTIPDLVGDLIGQPNYPVPFLAPNATGPVILNGVNYASGAGGIVNLSGYNFAERLSMDVQIDHFSITLQQLDRLIGRSAARDLVMKSLVTVTVGSNDFIDNYLLPIGQGNIQTADSFIDQLIINLRSQLTRIYSLDARKVVVSNVGPIGCIPNQRGRNQVQGSADQLDANGCVARANQLAVHYNRRLKDLLRELNENLPGATFLLANVYDIFSQIIADYSLYGFETASVACCGSGGQYRGLIPCGLSTFYCLDRSKYVFWDTYHPSEATNIIVARLLVDGDTSAISPINIRQLVDL